MESYRFLLDIALILLATKVLGLLSGRINLPQVVGALIAGVVLGPAVLGIVSETEFLNATAEVGVIILMFTAGMETDVKELKHCGGSAIVIALLGVAVPLIGGMGVMYVFNDFALMPLDEGCSEILQNIFVGVILTATSVSITVGTLRELGRLNSRSGNAIMAAAIIDDILGIIALTVIMGFADSEIKITIVLLKILVFFIVAAAAGVIFCILFRKWYEKSGRRLRRHTITAFIFCLLLSFCAEEFFGVADITGAYIAGVVIACTGKGEFLFKKFDIASYLYFSPIFFASIGLKVSISEMNSVMILFTLVLTIIAVLTKVIGCGLGARICRYSRQEALQIGTGMISRGEVALIIMSKGTAMGLLSAVFAAPIVITVTITTIVTPILLKFVYKN